MEGITSSKRKGDRFIFREKRSSRRETLKLQKIREILSQGVRYGNYVAVRHTVTDLKFSFLIYSDDSFIPTHLFLSIFPDERVFRFIELPISPDVEIGSNTFCPD